MTTLQAEKAPTKKELKRMVNENGFYAQMMVKPESNAPAALKDKIPEGATYFEGIASNGELNRNGYIIRESAWRAAIETYFLNPVVLLQHDVEKPIGMALSATITSEGLSVSGYIFDDLTDGKFGRGLLKALSTGHYTKEVEFENTNTGTVLTEQEFSQLDIREQMSDVWVMAVTKLDWVEFSLVTIGSNKKSMITHKNAIMERLDIDEKKLELLDAEAVEEEKQEVAEVPEATEEVVEEAVEVEGGEELPEVQEEVSSEDSEKEAESADESEEEVAEVENTEVAEESEEEELEEIETEQNKVKVSKEQYERLSSASQILLKTLGAVETLGDEEVVEEEGQKEDNALELPLAERLEALCASDEELKTHLTNLAGRTLSLQEENAALQEEVDTLKASLNEVPQSKRILFNAQNNTKKEEIKNKKGAALSSFFASKGINL